MCHSHTVNSYNPLAVVGLVAVVVVHEHALDASDNLESLFFGLFVKIGHETRGTLSLKTLISHLLWLVWSLLSMSMGMP